MPQGDGEQVAHRTAREVVSLVCARNVSRFALVRDGIARYFKPENLAKLIRQNVAASLSFKRQKNANSVDICISLGSNNCVVRDITACG